MRKATDFHHHHCRVSVALGLLFCLFIYLLFFSFLVLSGKEEWYDDACCHHSHEGVSLHVHLNLIKDYKHSTETLHYSVSSDRFFCVSSFFFLLCFCFHASFLRSVRIYENKKRESTQGTISELTCFFFIYLIIFIHL